MLTSAGGCSLTAPFGTTQLTAGRVPAWTSAKKLSSVWTFPTSLSWRTVVNEGSGFQIPGVPADCGSGGQVIAPSSSQSGSVPSAT